ncbi:MAG: 16S rRNA (cytosine(1402)-N(4))-methyltransferase [Candidatus Rokuibacteriota bacterium]|nr:MAG: 16S rRNA (cytosine(1402)-N(4))-methyltransferase [Candidatus Rokubacteria bacterium]
MATYRAEARREVAVRSGRAEARPPLHFAREGYRARSRGPDPDSAGRARAGRAREGGHARRRRPSALRGVGPDALRGVRADQSGRAAVGIRQAVEPGSVAVHVPVLLDEVLFLLRPRRGGWVIDGTVGMGGHAEAMLERTPDEVRLLGIDRDPEALARAGARLGRFGARAVLRRSDFRDLDRVARADDVRVAQSVLLDLGVSSPQLEQSGRGLSFQTPAPLDMRLDPAGPQTAADLLNGLPEAELARIIFELGDERYARRIAGRIVRRRPLRTTDDLVAAVRAAVPRARWPRRTHVATKTFQALRIAVNDELGALAQALPRAAALLAVGGRCGVISFHSGEDRVVKRTFRALASEAYAELMPAPLVPGADEVRANPRARSARLRVLERISS